MVVVLLSSEQLCLIALGILAFVGVLVHIHGTVQPIWVDWGVDVRVWFWFSSY